MARPGVTVDDVETTGQPRLSAHGTLVAGSNRIPHLDPKRGRGAGGRGAGLDVPSDRLDGLATG